MSDAIPKPSRPMKYPYTLTAKIAQFPLKYYIKNQWIWKYYVVGIILSIPVFYKIDKAVNSPGNIAAHEAIKRKEAQEHH